MSGLTGDDLVAIDDCTAETVPLLLDGRTIAAQLRIPEGTLYSWASRGVLARRGQDERGRTLYDVDEVIALAATRRPRRSRGSDASLARMSDSTTRVPRGR